MLFKKGVLKNLASFTGKHLCWSLTLLKLRTPARSDYLKSVLLQENCSSSEIK